MELNVLIIDKDKNTTQIDLMEYEYNMLFADKVDTTKIKKHLKLKDLDLEVRRFLKEIKLKEDVEEDN